MFLLEFELQMPDIVATWGKVDDGADERLHTDAITERLQPLPEADKLVDTLEKKAEEPIMPRLIIFLKE